MSARVKVLPVSAEAMSRLTALASEVTIDQLQRAELAVEEIYHPMSSSMLIDLLFHTADPVERERLLRQLEAPR